jgi:hypothetical protein
MEAGQFGVMEMQQEDTVTTMCEEVKVMEKTPAFSPKSEGK